MSIPYEDLFGPKQSPDDQFQPGGEINNSQDGAAGNQTTSPTILWTDIMKLDLGMTVYEEITDKKKLLKQLDEKQDDYNHSSDDKMDLVFFE